MRLIVNPHKIVLDKEEAVNEKEINISKCTFEFSEEITEDYVKEAYFTFKGNAYKKIIVNDECAIPQEVLTEEGTVEVGVVAYLVEDETEIKRYNPSPIWFKTDKGSLRTAQNSQPITPSEMEQYEQALQDGLAEVNSKLDDIDTAITQTNNLNLDANKVGSTTTVEITKKDGTTKTVNILDGTDGRNGTDGQDGITPTIGDNGNWYLGETDTGKPSRGEKGETGATGQTGQAGADGFSPSASVTKSGSVATITITDKNSTTTTTISDGTNGQDGHDGVGVPSGGTQGQVLIKNSATDYDTIWGNVNVSNKATFLGSIDNYSTQNTAIDLDELAEGLYILYFPRYTSTINLYYKITINGTTYQYALGFDDYDGNKAFTIDHTIYLWMVNNINGKTITSDTDIVRILISNVKPSIPRLDVYEKRIIARTSGVMVVNGEQENIINLATIDTAQTISAKKTFTTLPESSVVPTTDNQLVNKKYVDDNAGGSLSTPFNIYYVQFDDIPYDSGYITASDTQYTQIKKIINDAWKDTAQNSFMIRYFTPNYYLSHIDTLFTFDRTNETLTISDLPTINFDTAGIMYTLIRQGASYMGSWTYTNDEWDFSGSYILYLQGSYYWDAVNKEYVDGILEENDQATYTISSLAGNSTYKLGEITSLTITAVTTFDKESVIYFESGSTATSISIPDTLTNLGDVPTLTASGGVNTGTCDASKNYIISVLNNIAIWKKY